MTFYEAALRVLEVEGRPLHILEITQKSIALSLLSHVGKTPEQTMLSRLAAMARRTRDRRLVVTAKDTFALLDWALPEDPEALAQTGVPEPNPEEDLPPLRPSERHPEPRGDNVRASGRQDRKRRRDEDEDRGGRKRRFPPVPEVVFEILSEPPGALTAAALVEKARSRQLVSEEFGPEQVLTALLEDNQRRIDAGRRPQFILSKETGEISLERAGAPSETAPLELQAAFAEALGIPLEGGRPVLPGKALVAAGEPTPVLEGSSLLVRNAARDARKTVARALRQRLLTLDAGTFEKSIVRVLQHLGYRELKVAKRSKDGPLMTARRREGSVELRFAIRILKGNPSIDRRMVQDLRRDLGHHAAQVGLIVSPGEVRGDARTEAQGSGGLVMLWCGDALGDKFLESKTAVRVTQVELFEVDESFFETARVDAVESLRKREERHREREQNEARQPAVAPPRREEELDLRRPHERASNISEVSADGREEREGAPSLPVEPLQAVFSDQAEGDDDEGDEDLEAASEFVGTGRPEGGTPVSGADGAGSAENGERKRRRRRRRGRRGRGPKTEGSEEAATGAASPAGPSGGASSEPSMQPERSEAQAEPSGEQET